MSNVNYNSIIRGGRRRFIIIVRISMGGGRSVVIFVVASPSRLAAEASDVIEISSILAGVSKRTDSGDLDMFDPFKIEVTYESKSFLS
mgnify:CR=1 FL=1